MSWVKHRIEAKITRGTQVLSTQYCVFIPVTTTPVGAFHAWMIAPRELVHEGLGTTKALNYSLKRWAALSCYLDDGAVPIDNNHIEQQIRPWALGRKNGLFAGSLRSAKRAAALMSLILSAKLNGHDVYAYLRTF